jgi:hypothetical protein
MADQLELRLDRSDSFGSPGYEDFEITSVLTEAESLFVKKFTSELNNRKGEGFEETEIRNQGLSALIKKGASLSASSSQVDVLTNGKFFDLPADFMYCIYEEITIDKLVCGSLVEYIKADVRITAHNEIPRLRRNKYKKPFYKNYGRGLVWRLVFSREVDGSVPASPATRKRHQLMTDGTFNVTNYTINYMKNPNGIIVDRTTVANQRNCILDESTHNAILDIAVDLMMNRVKEQSVKNIEGIKDLE